MARKDHGAIFRKGAATVLMEQQAEALAARELLLGAYERISDDQEDESTGDRGAGVTRQEEALELLCQMLSKSGPSTWTIHRHYTDNDVSAYSGKPRPQYAALMQAVEAGQVDMVVAWDPDRLHRSPAELEDFITAVERAGVEVVTLQAGCGSSSSTDASYPASWLTGGRGVDRGDLPPQAHRRGLLRRLTPPVGIGSKALPRWGT